MCISVPARIQSLKDNHAEVELAGLRKQVMLATEAKVGDWVLIYAGAAIRVLAPEEAEAGLSFFAQNKTHSRQIDDKEE